MATLAKCCPNPHNASHSTSKILEKSSKARTGADLSLSFKITKLFSTSMVHLNASFAHTVRDGTSNGANFFYKSSVEGSSSPQLHMMETSNYLEPQSFWGLPLIPYCPQ